MFQNCLVHFVNAQGALHKIASGQNGCTPFSLLCALSLRRLNTGQELRSLLSCMVLPSPGTPRAQLKQRQWGDSISLLFKEGEKINHSGWAFVPICHGDAITIPFSTAFVSQSKASGCDSESDSCGRLFMQLNHYNSPNSK